VEPSPLSAVILSRAKEQRKKKAGFRCWLLDTGCWKPPEADKFRRASDVYRSSDSGWVPANDMRGASLRYEGLNIIWIARFMHQVVDELKS
jgi:hypothetical protein